MRKSIVLKNIISTVLYILLLAGISEISAATVQLTFRVNMSNESGYSDVGIRGSWSNWYTSHKLTTTGDNIYEITLELEPGTLIEYKFVKLDTTGEIAEWENPPSDCSMGEYNNRYFIVPGNSLGLDIVCFGSCEDCPPVIKEIDMEWERFLSTNNHNYITVDENGEIWAGSRLNIVNIAGNTWTSYNTMEDEPIPWVQDIEIDKEGNIWAATIQGFSIFDGSGWHLPLSPPSYGFFDIKDIEVDNIGNVWMCGHSYGIGGLTKFDGTQWITYGTKDGLISDHCNALAIDENNNIWVGTDYGLSFFNGSTWTNHEYTNGLPRNDVRTIDIDPSGNIWCGTSSGVCFYDHSQWAFYDKNDGLVSNSISTIKVTSDGKIWIGTNSGISCYNNGTFTNYTLQDGLTSNAINQINEDKDGNVYAACEFGISMFDGNNWSQVINKDGLINNYINGIEIDNQKNKWFTAYGGISKFDGQNWERFDTDNQLPTPNIGSVHEDSDHNIWFTSDNGLIKLSNNLWTVLSTSDGLPSNNIYDVITDKTNYLWISHDMGISKFTGSEWVTYNTDDGLVDNGAKELFVDNNNNIWVITNSGLSKYDHNTFTNFTSPISFGMSKATCIEQDINGNIWLGTSYEDYWIYDGEKWTNHKTNHEYTGLVYSIKKDNNNNMWLASYHLDGFKIFNGVEWLSYSKDNDIPEKNISHIAFEDEQNTWFASLGVTKASHAPIPLTAQVSKTSIAFKKEPEDNDTIFVTTFAPWRIDCPDNWLSFNKTSGVGNDTIVVTATDNNLGFQRTSNINFYLKNEHNSTVNVIQESISTLIENNKDKVLFYPNPVSDLLTLKTNGKYNNITIMDITGNMIEQMDCKGKTNVQVDMGQLSPGMYIIKLQSKTESILKKVIKQ